MTPTRTHSTRTRPLPLLSRWRRRAPAHALALSSAVWLIGCPSGDDESNTGGGDSGTAASGDSGVSANPSAGTSGASASATAADSTSAGATSATATGGGSTAGEDTDTASTEGTAGTAGTAGTDSTGAEAGSTGSVSKTEMTFFVSSAPVFDTVGSATTLDVAGDGNLIFTMPDTNPPEVRRGILAADAFCQSLADSVQSPHSDWVAYLSTQGLPDLIDGGDGPQIDARDRIGDGPWFNADEEPLADEAGTPLVNGTLNASLGIVLGQASPANAPGNLAAVTAYLAARLDPQLILTETGAAVVNGGGSPLNGEWHDIFTGSDDDGTVYDGGYPERWFTNEQTPPPGGRTQWGTCNDWDYTRFGNAPPTEFGQTGHTDVPGGGFSPVWNSAHDTADCTVPGVAARGGAGHVYCFSPSGG